MNGLISEVLFRFLTVGKCTTAEKERSKWEHPELLLTRYAHDLRFVNCIYLKTGNKNI